MKILFLSSLLLLLQSCAKKLTSAAISNSNNRGGENTQLSTVNALDHGEKKFVKYYTPKTKDHRHDPIYMKRIEIFIEDIAREKNTHSFFLKLAKTIAWTETNWRHYSKKESETYVITGDDGKSYGMFQVNSTYHPTLPNLKENAQYAIEYLKEIYDYARQHNCSSGSNAGEHQDILLRRIYAHYNGGRRNRCRSHHKYDDKFLAHFHEAPWETYIN